MTFFFFSYTKEMLLKQWNCQYISCYAGPVDSPKEREEKLHLPIYMHDMLALFIWSKTTTTSNSKDTAVNTEIK